MLLFIYSLSNDNACGPLPPLSSVVLAARAKVSWVLEPVAATEVIRNLALLMMPLLKKETSWPPLALENPR